MDIMVLGSTKFKTLICPTAGRPSNTKWKNAVCGDDQVSNLQRWQHQRGCNQMIFYTNN